MAILVFPIQGINRTWLAQPKHANKGIKIALEPDQDSTLFPLMKFHVFLCVPITEDFCLWKQAK